MELASVDEENGNLVVKVSQRVLLNRLRTLLVLSVPWFLLDVCFFFGSKFSSLSSTLKDPLFYFFLFPAVVLPIGLIRAVMLLYSGQTFTFDRQSNRVIHNSRRIAVLSDLQEVKVSYSPYRGIVHRRVPVRGMAKFLLIPWPGAWIILRKQKPIQVLDTSMLIKMWLPGPSNAMLRGQMRQEAVTVAKRIAEYAGVPVQHDLPVQIATGWGG